MDEREYKRRLSEIEKDLERLKRHLGNLPVRWPEPAAGGDSAVCAQVRGVSSPSAGGQYLGKICRGPSTAVGVGPVPMPAGMTLPDTNDALLLHPPEMGIQSAHAIPTDGTVFVIGKTAGTVAAGLYKGFTIVVIESLFFNDPQTPISRFKVVTGPISATPRTVTGQLWDGSSLIGAAERIACVAGHGVGDVVYAYLPNGGTGVAGCEFLEVGVLGQEFEVELQQTDGTGMPNNPFKYKSQIRSSFISTTAMTPIDRPMLVTANVPAVLGRGRFVPSAENVYELVRAFETFSPMVPVLVATPTPGAGGNDPATTNYTIRDNVTHVTIATGVSHPNRPFGDTFKVVTGGTRGEGYYLTDGTFVLVNIFGEVYSTTPGCPTTP